MTKNRLKSHQAHWLFDGRRGTVRIALIACFLMVGVCVSSQTGWAGALCSMGDGQPSDGQSILERQGKRHEFCCAGCLKQFKEFPEKFAEELVSSAPAELISPEATCSNVCGE